MSPLVKTETEFAHLPIAVHDRVLGVDIVVHQRKNYQDVFEGGSKSGFSDGVRINTVGSDKRLDYRDRQYIAAWARRNLF